MLRCSQPVDLRACRSAVQVPLSGIIAIAVADATSHLTRRGHVGMAMEQDLAPTAQASDSSRFCTTSAEPVPIELLPVPVVSAAAGPAAATSPAVTAIAATPMRSVRIGKIMTESYSRAVDFGCPRIQGPQPSLEWPRPPIATSTWLRSRISESIRVLPGEGGWVLRYLVLCQVKAYRHSGSRRHFIPGSTAVAICLASV